MFSGRIKKIFNKSVVWKKAKSLETRTKLRNKNKVKKQEQSLETITKYRNNIYAVDFLTYQLISNALNAEAGVRGN